MSQANAPRVTIRFTPEEYAELRAKAGDQALSVFLREAGLAAATRKRRKTQVRPALEAQAAAAILARLAVHPHVAAFKAAAEADVAGEHGAEIATCQALLIEVRDLLLAALGKKTAASDTKRKPAP
jgi:hypothetical protein